MIHLRPHHLLCTQGYSGKGYDEKFVAHMNEVVHELKNVPGTRIMLTFSTDTLCSCCPHKEGEDLCDTQEKVKRFDRKTIEYFGLEEKEYVYEDLERARALMRKLGAIVIHTENRAVEETAQEILRYYERAHPQGADIVIRS